LSETKSELAATKKKLAENIEHSKVAIAHLAPLIDRHSRMYSGISHFKYLFFKFKSFRTIHQQQ
jgi:hypothetical protein